MALAYHRLPSNLQGEVLYPLNQLRDLLPEVYRNQIQKYKGREFVLKYRIPPLDCLWNDALHLSPIHPKDVARAYREAGGTWGRSTWIEVDTRDAGFCASNSCIFLNTKKVDEAGNIIEGHDHTDFLPYSDESLEELRNLPDDTKRYYADMFSKGKNPLLYVFAPHVLYRGKLNIAGCSRIEIDAGESR